MSVQSMPREYQDWRSDQYDRAEDAAYSFGYHLITKCRDEAIGTIPQGASPETKEQIEKAVDIALHNVMDLLEGFWKLEVGSGTSMELVLKVQIQNENTGENVENIEISPCKLDLPIGYWKWAEEREFR